ncbi:DUF551 domain-containing protein [Salmonella enterica]|nr:DUF551 domain-containing protein [Salmonella enterica]
MIQWIKCSDQMPEEGAMVLTAFRGVVRTAVCKVVDNIGSKMFVSELDRCHGIQPPIGLNHQSHHKNKTKPLSGLFLYQDTVHAVLIIISGSVDESVTVTVYTPAVGLASDAPDSPPTTAPSLRHT